MLDQAITKINTEIQEKNQMHITKVGEFLKDYLKMDPNAAEKITQEGKTIQSSIKAMRDKAKESAVDGVAMLTEEEGFEIVLTYYEIDPADQQVAKEVEAIDVDSFDVKLDDFL